MSRISALKREALKLEARRDGDDLPVVALYEGDSPEAYWAEHHPGEPFPTDVTVWLSG